MAKKQTNQKPKKVNKPVRHTKAELEQLEMQQQMLDEQALENKFRILGVVIFAFSVLFFFIAVISGDGVWNIVHNNYIGIFGWIASILLPILCLVYSILFQTKKGEKKIGAEPVCIIIFLLLVSAFVFVVQNDDGLDFVQAIRDEYNNAPYEFNAGAFGAVLGCLLLTLGKAPAIIVDLLLILVVIMLTSKLTVNQFFKTTAKPVKKAVEKATPYIEERRERRKSNIDVYLDDEPPIDAEAKKPEKKTKKAKNQP